MNFNPTTALACAQTIHALYTHDVGPSVNAHATDTQALVMEAGSREQRAASREQGAASSDQGRLEAPRSPLPALQAPRSPLFSLAFPGTASFRDGITDLKVRKVVSGAGKLHRGFVYAAKSVYPQIVAQLPPGCRVMLSGHSLGGAVATIIADWLKGCGYEIESVYTFGSPRLANGPWQRCYNRLLGNRTFRIVNAGDPVPHMPWFFGTYRHVDQLVYLNRKGGVEHSVVFAAAMEMGEKLRPKLDDQMGSGSATSHFVRPSAHVLTSYITALQRLV